VVEPDASQSNTNNQATTTYTYDALNHLTNVNMPRRMPGGNVVTQTRTFNYLVGSSISAYLQSATNPESGTVSYTYSATDGMLGTKTDAMNTSLYYYRDSYGRVTQVQHSNPNDSYGNPVPPTTIRTYAYDTNSVDNTFSQYSQGRLTTVQYNVPAISNTQDNNGHEIDFTGDTVIEMYSYTGAGQVAAKRLRVTRTDTLNETLTADLNGSWTYNNEGKLKGVTYPGDPNGLYPPPTYSYSYDGMGRLAGMTETAPSTYTMVSGVTYNAAGQMTAGLDTRTYNSMGQVTNIHSSSLNITYNYSATQNNGKITSQVDNLTGEQVTYAYDSLNRLVSAQAGSTWGQGFAYDPFGNLTDKTALAGSVPTMHLVPDASTNHLGGEDANGNPPGAMDAESRLTITGTMRYAYDAQNKRVWSCTASGTYFWMPCTSDTYYFYGPNGKLLAQFAPVYTLAYRDQQNVNHPATFTFQNSSNSRAYFGGRMLGDQDRLGSRGGKYFPYGEDRSNPPPANDQVKFATYTRDSATGLDYADQRYYSSSYGRFASPDQYKASGGPASPQSWNRYAYTIGDAVNFYDPTGRVRVPPDYCSLYPDDEICHPCGPDLEGWCAPGFGPGGGPPPPQPQGGDGGDNLLPVGAPGARIDLGKRDCWTLFGFVSADAAQSAFDRIRWRIVHLGILQVKNIGGSVVVQEGTPPPAQNYPGGSNTIEVNYDYNWLDFSHVWSHNTSTGVDDFFDFLGAENATLGTKMSTSQLEALILLHELMHTALGGNKPQETSNADFNTPIYNACIK
jgi:RHS repeat-associated protein